MDIKTILKEKRPNLSDGSIKTYASILANLHYKVFGTKEINDISNFNNTNLILNNLSELSANKRKTILSALVVLTNADDYKTQMNQDVNAYNEEIGKQLMSETQKDNWIEKDDIQTTFNKLEKRAKVIYKQPTIGNTDLQEIQNFIIIALLGGVFIPPRRALDFCNFKISNVDEAKDNYYDSTSNKFVFNSYKTAKTYGKQEISVPIKLKNIIKKWKSVNPTDYLLFDTNMNPLTSVKLNQRMNKIFGDKKISVNAMRHTYLTSNFKNTRADSKKLETVMEQMGSSISMADNYVKLDAPV
jgi:integrase